MRYASLITLVLTVVFLAVSRPAQLSAAADFNEKPDTRLSQTVTYEAKHKPVKFILADLSKMTGVTLKSGITTQDWQVRDRRMNIFVKDLPLLSLMNSMARVMDFTWDKNDKVDPPTYRMYMDRKKLVAAEAAASKAEQDFRRHMTEQRRKLVDYVRNLPDYSPEELEKLKEDDPYLYLLHQRGSDRLLKALLDEVPGYEDAFMTYERILNPPAGILSDSTLDLLLSCMKDKSAVPGWGGLPSSLAEMDVKKLKTGLVRLTTPTPELVRYDLNWCFGGIGAIVGENEYFIQSLQDPEAPYGNARAKLECEAIETNTPYGDLWMRMGSQMEQLNRDDTRQQEEMEGCEPLAEHPDEPWLHAKVKLEPGKNDPDALKNALASLAVASGYNVISDSFGMTRVMGSIPTNEREFKDVLNAISDNYGYNWNRHGPTLEFRDRNWFRRRRTQIPDEWIERWKANFKANGYAVMDDLGQMAALSFEQYDENVDTDPVFQSTPMFTWTIRNGRFALEAYNCLSTSQRKALLKEGVDYGTLRPEQIALFVHAFQPMDTMEWNPPKFWEDPEEQLVLTGKYQRGEEGPAFVLAVHGREDKLLYEKAIELRKYVEPPKPATEKEEPKGKPAGK